MVNNEENNSTSSSITVAAADYNQNISFPSPSLPYANTPQRESQYHRVPMELFFNQGEALVVINLAQDYDDKYSRKLWISNVFIFGQPYNTLMVIRGVQLLSVNLATLLLPFISVVWEYVHDIPSWSVSLALAFHSLLFVIEECTLYELPATRRKLQLYYAISISLLFAICECHIALSLSVLYFDQYTTSMILAFLTAIYFIVFWYGEVRATERILLQPSTYLLSFNGVTRPETSDTRLNVGPQLVFPIPQEYAVPCDPEVNYYLF